MNKVAALLGFVLLSSAACFGQATLPPNEPLSDPFNGFLNVTCPAQQYPGVQPQPRQFVATSSTSLTGNGTSQTMTLSTTTESDGASLINGEELMLGNGEAPVSVTAETPAGGTWGTGLTDTGFLAHASIEFNSVSIWVNGAKVAFEQFGACYATGAAGSVTCQVMTQKTTSRAWISVRFLVAPSAAPVVNYTYLPTEITTITNISGLNVTVTPQNSHTAPFSVMYAGFRIGQCLTSRWNFIDPLNRVAYPTPTENIAEEPHFANLGNVLSGVGIAQDQVFTTLSAAITATGLQNVTIGSCAGISGGPGMMLIVGRTSANVEWVNVPQVGGVISTSPCVLNVNMTKLHSAGDAVEDMQHSVGVNCQAPEFGTVPIPCGKYTGDPTWGSLFVATGDFWTELYIPRMRQYNYMGVGESSLNSIAFASPGVGGLNNSPDGAMIFKAPTAVTTNECTSGKQNIFGYENDVVLDGNPKVGHITGGTLIDRWNPQLYQYVRGDLNWFLESPWLLYMMPTQTDNCPELGLGQDFTTTPLGSFQANHGGKSVLDAMPYVSVGSNAIGKAATLQTNVYPLSNAGIFQGKQAMMQFVQGRLDPILFPTAASTGTPNIASISCTTPGSTSSTLSITLSTAWLASNNPPNGSMHFDPFTYAAIYNGQYFGGDVVTIFGTTNYNTAAGFPVQVIGAVQGTHQLLVQWPAANAANPCAGSPATETTGVAALGLGHTVASFNIAMGTALTTLGTAGTLHQNVAVSCAGVDCQVNVTGPIEPYSIQIIAWNNEASQNTCSLTDAKCAVIAADQVNSPGTWSPPVTGTTTGNFYSNTVFSNTLSAAVTAPSTTLKVTAFGAPAILPTMMLFVNDASPEYVRVASLTTKQHQITADQITSGTLDGTGFANNHANGATISLAFPGVTSANSSFTPAAFNYETAATLYFTLPANPTGFTYTINYTTNGWGYSGTGSTGFLDISKANDSLFGSDGTCIDQGTGAGGGQNCSGASPTYATPAGQLMLDAFQEATSAYYQRNYMEEMRVVLPHMLACTSYRNGGGRGDPANIGSLLGEASFADCIYSSMVYRFDGATPAAGVESPTMVGSPLGWGLAPVPNISSWPWMNLFTHYRPQFDFMEWQALADSDLYRMVPICLHPYGTGTTGDCAAFMFDSTQQALATDAKNYFNAVVLTPTANGTFTHIGIDLWGSTSTPTSGQAEPYGPITDEDNARDGRLSCNVGTQPTVDIVDGFNLTPIPEAVPSTAPNFPCYGDWLDNFSANMATMLTTMMSSAQTVPVVPTGKQPALDLTEPIFW